MIKPAKIIFLILLWSFLGTNALSQYFIKLKADSIGFEIDSVILAVDSLPGLINWEISKDSLTWESMNETNDTLSIRIDDEAYYRAVYYEGTCYPVESDVALVSFKAIEVTGNSVIIDPTGGVYFLPSGIKLIVPPGAVNENVTASFDLLDSINADLKIPFDGDTGKVFCTGIYCEPPGTGFLKPIRINIPAPNYRHNDLPYVYLFDSDSGLWEKYTGDLTCSEKLHFIEFSTDKLVSPRVHLYKDLFALGKSENTSKQEDCKEGYIHIESGSYDHTGQQGSSECFVNSDDTKVVFLDCPGKPENTSTIQEIGKNCEPVALDNIDIIGCLRNGESATITVTVTIGGKPLKDQEVIFYNEPLGLTFKDSKTSERTDENGKAQFIVTCNIDNFSGDISYNVNYKYFLEVIQASDGVTSVKIQNCEQTGTIVKDSYFEACIVSSITLYQPPMGFLDVGDTYSISVNCKDHLGNSIDCGTLEYIVEEYPNGNSGVVSIDDATGVVTALKSGFVLIKARSSYVESNVIGLSVSYQGDVTMSKTIDWNDYNSGCCCEYDLDQCWIMTYSGSMHIKFYLDFDVDRYACATFEGCETIIYYIEEPSPCRSETFHQATYTTQLWCTGDATTGEILQGAPFSLVFNYNHAPADENCVQVDYLNAVPNQITVHGQLTSPNTIGITSVYFIPEPCVATVYDGTGVLH